MPEIFNWDIVAGNNNSTPPDGFPENMEYDEVNNSGREVMAVVARFIKGSLGGTNTTAGTQPAYTLVSGFTLGAYAAGQVFAFVAHATSTGAVTLNVDGLGAGAVTDSKGNQLGSGDILANGIYLVTRTASAFRVLGHLAAQSIQQLALNTLGQAYLAGGTANAITVTTGLFTAYANGQLIAFRAANNNTGACTINIDSLGAEALEDFSSQALATGDIVTDRIYLAGRTGGEWRVLTSLPVDLASQVSGTLPVANGGTGGTTAAAARANLGTDIAGPIGSVAAWLTSSAPTGWLHCAGQAISRTTYADLFAVIGDDFGAGDGSTTFNVPDFRGEFLRGWDAARGADPDAASRTDRGDGTTGDNVGTKQATQNLLHGHPFRTSNSASNDSDSSGGLMMSLSPTIANQAAFTGTPSNTNGQQIGGSGGNESRPRNVNVMWIIRALAA